MRASVAILLTMVVNNGFHLSLYRRPAAAATSFQPVPATATPAARSQLLNSHRLQRLRLECFLRKTIYHSSEPYAGLSTRRRRSRATAAATKGAARSIRGSLCSACWQRVQSRGAPRRARAAAQGAAAQGAATVAVTSSQSRGRRTPFSDHDRRPSSTSRRRRACQRRWSIGGRATCSATRLGSRRLSTRLTTVGPTSTSRSRPVRDQAVLLLVFRLLGS